MQKGNIFRRIPDDRSKETFEILAQESGVKVERIISNGHSSPEDGWYDQDRNEWVILLRGAAVIAFEHGSTVTLREGDYLSIDAHEKHKVVSTSADPETVWLAIHF